MAAFDDVYERRATLVGSWKGYQRVRLSIVLIQSECPPSEPVPAHLLGCKSLAHVCPQLEFGHHRLQMPMLLAPFGRTVYRKGRVRGSKDDEVERWVCRQWRVVNVEGGTSIAGGAC